MPGTRCLQINVTEEVIILIQPISGRMSRVAEKGNREDVDTRDGRIEHSNVRIVRVANVGDDSIERNSLVLSGVTNVRRQSCKESYRRFCNRLADSLLTCNKNTFTFEKYNVYVCLGFFKNILTFSK